MGGETRTRAAGAKDPESGERTLIYIPIIHTQADMGALSESIQRLKVKRLGRKGWERTVNLVDKLWAQIEQAIESLILVAELAEAGSRNHRLLLRLREKGATIMGTESSELLVEEYQLVKEVFASGKPKVATRGEARQKALRDSLLKRRDQYIARRINDTLLAGETGLIFLGMLHSVRSWLDKDIRIVYPIH
jgi:hypothetical protein